jgi:hypothetical protein
MDVSSLTTMRPCNHFPFIAYSQTPDANLFFNHLIHLIEKHLLSAA